MNQMQVDRIVFQCRSLVRFQYDLTVFPKLESTQKLIKKGLELLERYTPRVFNYLAKQKALADISKYHVLIQSAKKRKEKRIMGAFKIWIKKERTKRIVFLILEGSVLPLTPFLAILPGPNVFFYVPFLLFYFHYRSFQGLKRIDFNTVSIEITGK